MNLPISQKQVHAITCSRTGVTVAALTVEKIAGHIPYLSQWKGTQALHPLFSLGNTELLQFGRNTWHNFCTLSQEESGMPMITDKHEMMLRITALAMLHKMADVHQSTIWIPTLSDVFTNWTSLMQLSYWKNYLDSTRFRFPELRISKNNNGIDLTGYIQECWESKKSYESKVRELSEAERIRTADEAVKGLRDEIAGKTPRSKKLLWRWFLAHIPSRYAADTEGWMWTLFDAEKEDEIAVFTMADIDLFEEIFLCEVPTGSSVSAAFLERLRHKRSILETKFETFEILVPNSIAEGAANGSISTVEPKLADFPGKVQFLIAHSKWKLAHSNQTKHRDAAIKLQQSITVNPTFIPNIEDVLPTRTDDESEDIDTNSIGVNLSDESTAYVNRFGEEE